MTAYQHYVSGFFVKREEADIARAKLLARGQPQASMAIYENTTTAPAPAFNASSNVTLFVASPLIAPLVMLGWGASLGAVVGALAGAVNSPKKDGKLADLVADAIRAGQVVLVIKTSSPVETKTATDVIQEAVGSFKNVSTV